MTTKDESGSFEAKVAKVDPGLGVVFGFGIVSWKRTKGTKQHQPYFDLQDEHVPEALMLSATFKFMQSGASMDAMHDEVTVGKVLYSFPLTREIAKAMGIHDADEYGWMVGVVPNSPEVLAKFVSGEWSGFSIGGWASSKAYAEGTCPDCGAELGAGKCAHQPDDEAAEGEE